MPPSRFIEFPPRIVYGRSPGRAMTPSDRVWAGYTGRKASERAYQEMMNKHRGGLLARADATRRLPNTGHTAAFGARGAGQGVDWLKKIQSTRRTSFQVPYKGPKTMGTMPKTHIMGQKVLEHIQRQKQRQIKIIPAGDRSLGSCWRTTVNRMKMGYKAAYGKDLLAGRTQTEKDMFDCIAGTRKGTYPRLWRKVPHKLQYRGVPGALAQLGVADVVEGDAVWRGEMEPGAPLQIWEGRPGRVGHSAVFERYIRDKSGKIIGLVYSDQWMDYKVMRRQQGILAPKVIGAKFGSWRRKK